MVVKKPAPKPVMPAPSFKGGSSGSSAHMVFKPPPPPPPPPTKPNTQQAHFIHPIHSPATNPSPHPSPSPRFADKFVTGTPDKLKPMISAAAAKYNVPSSILSGLLKQESGFNPKAQSPAGAIGIAQFMPDTAKSMGIDPSDPAQAISGAAQYLSQSLQTFGGDMAKALASYNAGTGAVQEYGGVPPYSETQNYVKNIMSDAANADEGVATDMQTSQDPDQLLQNIKSQTQSLHNINQDMQKRLGKVAPTMPGIGKDLATTQKGLNAMNPQAQQFQNNNTDIGNQLQGLLSSVKDWASKQHATHMQNQQLAHTQVANNRQVASMPTIPVGTSQPLGGGSQQQFGGFLTSPSSSNNQQQQQQQQPQAPVLSPYPTAPSGQTSFGPITV